MHINVIEFNPYRPTPYVFTEAAIYLHSAICAAGYTSTLLHNSVDINNKDDYSIVLCSDFREPLLHHLNADRIIYFNFEQLASTSSLVTLDYLAHLRRSIVFDYHSDNVAFLTRLEPSGDFYEIPFVPPSILHTAPPLTPSTDIVFYGSMNQRRERVLNKLTQSGFSVNAICGGYGAAIDTAIRQSRIMLHVHHYDTTLFPVLRVMQAVRLGVPVVAETSLFSSHSNWLESGIHFADYDNLVPVCAAMLSSETAQIASVTNSSNFAQSVDFKTLFDLAMNTIIVRKSCTKQLTQ